MAFLKSIASVFQPREVKVVRERQERSVKVTDIFVVKLTPVHLNESQRRELQNSTVQNSII